MSSIEKEGETLAVPMSAHAEVDGRLIMADFVEDIGPDDPRYEALLAEYNNPPSCAALLDAED